MQCCPLDWTWPLLSESLQPWLPTQDRPKSQQASLTDLGGLQKQKSGEDMSMEKGCVHFWGTRESGREELRVGMTKTHSIHILSKNK